MRAFIVGVLVLQCVITSAHAAEEEPHSKGSILRIPGAALIFLSPTRRTAWHIGHWETIQWKTQNIPSDSLVQFFLGRQLTPEIFDNFGVGQTYKVMDGKLRIQIPMKYCGGECGALEKVRPGKYRLNAIVYGPPNVYGGRPEITSEPMSEEFTLLK